MHVTFLTGEPLLLAVFFSYGKKDCWKLRLSIYSQTCIERSPLRHRKNGLLRKVTSNKRFNSYEISQDSVRKRWPFNTGDSLTKVTVQTGLTSYVCIHSLLKNNSHSIMFMTIQCWTVGGVGQIYDVFIRFTCSCQNIATIN